jgi:hypothetical protein
MDAPRSVAYRALLDARAVATWMVPDGMTSHVHAFDAREGGSFRISLETADPAMRGEMIITYELLDANGGTDLVAVHDGLPPGLSPADNETGWRLSLAKLKALVEGARRQQDG